MDNNTVPPIAFGTGGSSFKNTNLLKNGLKEYINIGGRIIDSAEKYNSGVIIKEFIKVDRNAFYIISKIRAHQHPQSEIENVIKNKILKDLNTNYLDELVIHSACEEKYRQHRINTWLEFKKLKDKGIIKNMGLSTFNIDQINHLIKNTNIKPDSLHIEYSLYNHNDELYNYCKKENIQMYAFSPLATRKGARDKILNGHILESLYQKYKCNYQQLVFSWLLSKNIIPISASSNKKHLIENFNTFNMEEEDIRVCDMLQDPINICKYNIKFIRDNIFEVDNLVRQDIFDSIDRHFPQQLKNGNGAKYDIPNNIDQTPKLIYNDFIKKGNNDIFHKFINSQNFLDLIMGQFKNSIKTKYSDEFLLNIDSLKYQHFDGYIQSIEDIVRKRKKEDRKTIPDTIFCRYNLSTKGDNANQACHRDHENRLFSGLLYLNNFDEKNKGQTLFWSGNNNAKCGEKIHNVIPKKNKAVIFLCNKNSIHSVIKKENTNETRKTIYFMASSHKSSWKYIQKVND